MFCDDPSNIISSGIDFLNVIGQGNDEEKKQNLEQGEEADDPRKEFAVRKYSIVPLDLSNIKGMSSIYHLDLDHCFMNSLAISYPQYRGVAGPGFMTGP